MESVFEKLPCSCKASAFLGSDFHHNGDLQNYADPWEINAGILFLSVLLLEDKRSRDADDATRVVLRG